MSTSTQSTPPTNRGFSTTLHTAVTAELLEQDAALPLDFMPAPVGAPSSDVFLTGATGFVGAEILWKILEHSSARVYCHVRARSVEEGHERLAQSLRTLGSMPRSWRARVIPILGDLSKPCLGISGSEWAEIAAHTGTIFHVGALVNHVAPYRMFRRPNINAVHELLRLSATTAQKQIHHISSLGYWSGYCGEASEASRNLAGPGAQAPGYLLSKWVSDRLMEQASERGFPVAIYRLGYVSGGWHGASNLRGWLELHLRAFARLRLMPDGETQLAVTPVDLLAADLWALSQRPDAIGQAYNLAYREQVISMADVEQAFADIGLPIRRVSGAQWYAAFQAAPQDAYMELLQVFLQESPPQWNAERHAFSQRVSAATGARLGHPAPFSKSSYLKAMLGGFVQADRELQRRTNSSVA